MENNKYKKFDFKNISEEDKKKYLFFSILLLFCLIVGCGIYMYQSSEEEENVDFSNGKTDLIEYNNKLDALRGKEIDSTDNLEYVFRENATLDNSTPDFEAIDRQIANWGNNPQPTPEQPTTTPQNNHNVYGDYNMWQTNEPKGSSIGYRDTNNKPQPSKKSKEIKHTAPVYEEVEVERPKVVKNTPTPQPLTRAVATNNSQGISETEQRRMMLRTGKRNVENTANIRFNIDGDQIIKNGGSVKLKTMEDSFISNTFIPKYSVVYGKASFGEDRINITISSIKVENSIVHCSLEGYDMDGLLGVGVNIGSISGTSQVAKEEIERSLNLNRTRLGQVISSLFTSKNKNDIRVKLLNNHNLIFIQR